jgi:very-short-patch-repair endonuclease
MRNNQIHNRPYLKDIRRELRKEPTEAEAFLWKILRGKNINGRKFRRQHSIENYIVDFYCAEEKLVIELDGKIHLNQKEMDFERDKRLKELGYNVLRFENERVFRELEKVVCIIEANFKTINKFGSELTPPLE